MKMEKKYLTTGQVGKILGVSRVTVYKWIKNKKIEGIRLPGGRYAILKEKLIEIFKNQELIEKSLKEIEKSYIGTNKFKKSLEKRKMVKILIGDDEKEIVETLKEFLEKRNSDFKIVGAFNGFEVGKYVYSFKPDILVLDIFMPGINGFEICNLIKNDPETKNIKIIVITGYPEDGNIEKVKKEGADYVFLKPLDYFEIEEKIKELIKI